MKTLFGALMSMVALVACTSPSVSQPEQASRAQVQTQQSSKPIRLVRTKLILAILR